MKKRFFSMLTVLALCLTLLPTAVFAENDAEELHVCTCETACTEESMDLNCPVCGTEGALAEGCGKYVAGETRQNNEPDNAPAFTAADVQALIDALPDEVTADNAAQLEAQLMTIDEALAELSGDQLAKLDMTRYETVCAALTEMTAVQEEGHTHYLCGGDICTGVGHTCAGKTTFEAWTSNDSLPETGVYYLTQDVTLNSGLAVTGELTLDLNGHSIQAGTERGTVIYFKGTGSFTLTDCNGSNGVHYFVTDADRNDAWKLSTPGETDSLAVTGGIITHSSTFTGQGVSVTNGSRFTMYNGTICGNYLTAYVGAGVYVHKGAFTMYGGAIRGNATTDGGGVFVNGDAVFTMHGGAISENRASGSGGGVHVGSGNNYTTDNAVFTMTGGTITGNAVTGTAANGGGVYVGGKYSGHSDAVFTMSGGEINDNRASGSGGGVYVGSVISDAIFTMSSDAKITGNTATGSAATGGVCMGGRGTLRLSDSVEIKDNKADNTNSNVYLPDNTAIEITGNLTGGASTVGVTLENMPASGKYIAFAKAASGVTLTDADKNVFFIDNASSNPNCKLMRGGSELLVTYGEQHIHPICGDTCSHQKADGSYEHPNVTWTGTDTLPDTAGHWYLTGNVTLIESWKPADGTVLDLNGCRIVCEAIGDGAIKIIEDDATFTLTDCNGSSGKHCFTDRSDGSYKWVLDDHGAIPVNGGVITHGAGGRAPGAGVYMTGGTFNMYGGTIVGNYGKGGVSVGVESGTTDGIFNMYGGAVRGNSSVQWGGVSVCSGGTFTMAGGEITDNMAAIENGGGVFSGGTLKLSGNVKITDNGNCKSSQDINVMVIQPITVSGELSDSACVGITSGVLPPVTEDDPRPIATAQGSWIKAGNFVSDNVFYKVTVSNDGKTASLEVHGHVWGAKQGSAANILQEYCTVTNCTATGGTLTLTASDKDYDAAPCEAVITASDWHSSTENYKIVYEKKNDDGSFTSISGAPTAWGDYRASITVDGVTAAQEFQIKPYTLYSGDFAFRTPSDLTYNGQSKTAAVTAKDAIASAIGIITVKYYDANGQETAAPTNAGTYTVQIDVARGVGYRAETGMFDQAWTFTIQKADSTGEPQYTKITSGGKTLADAKLTTTGSTLAPSSGTLEWIDSEGNVLPNDTRVEANKTYKWRFKPTDANYKPLTGEIELYHVPYSGGSSAPTYPVSVTDKIENGSVSVSPRYAERGDTVTITVEPDGGYVLETITVTDKNGNELKLTDKGDGKYSFTMPSGKVEIKATFMEDNSLLSFFYDVPNGAYYYEAVKWAVEKGITDGIGNSLFGPDLPCTRAQIVTFLWRAAGSPEPMGAGVFSDIPAESYYAKAVAWAVENGVTTGTGEGKFSPDAACSRAQAVTLLARALNAKAEGKAAFTDVPAGSYYADAVAWAAASGVTSGIGNGQFGPDNDCVRAQIVTFLWRAYNK